MTTAVTTAIATVPMTTAVSIGVTRLMMRAKHVANDRRI